MIYYFGIEFAVLLMIWMIVASFIEGKWLEVL